MKVDRELTEMSPADVHAALITAVMGPGWEMSDEVRRVIAQHVDITHTELMATRPADADDEIEAQAFAATLLSCGFYAGFLAATRKILGPDSVRWTT